MLSKFFLKIFVYSVVLYLFFGVIKSSIIGSNYGIYYVNLIGLIIFYFVIFICLKLNRYNEKKLLFIVFLFNLIFVSLNIYLFYSYTGEIFEFTGSDSYAYHLFATNASKGNLLTGIQDFIATTKYRFDDTGFIFYLSIIYSFFKSPLVVRFFNIILNLITVLLLFRIAKQFMAMKFAFIASVVFGIASYTVYYQSSGLKETLMLLLIVASFYYYYAFSAKPRLKNIFLFLTFALLIMFFRVPLVVFIFASILITEYLKRGIRTKKIVILVTVLISVILIFYFFSDFIIKYTRSFSPAFLMESGFAAPNIFLPFSSLLAGIFGPFPSIIDILENRDIVMYAPSLILKGFLSSFFLFSFVFAWKRKEFRIFPIILFCLMQIVSLSFVLKAFKLRAQFPHFAFLIIASFYVMNILYKERGYHFIKFAIYCINFVLVFVLFFWTYLRL